MLDTLVIQPPHN